MRRLNRQLPVLLLWFPVPRSTAFDVDAFDHGVCPCAPWRSRNRRTAAAEVGDRRSGARARRTATGNDVTSSPTRRTGHRRRSSSPMAPSTRTRFRCARRRRRGRPGRPAAADGRRPNEASSSRRAAATCRAGWPRPPASKDRQPPTGCDTSRDHF